MVALALTTIMARRTTPGTPYRTPRAVRVVALAWRLRLVWCRWRWAAIPGGPSASRPPVRYSGTQNHGGSDQPGWRVPPQLVSRLCGALDPFGRRCCTGLSVPPGQRPPGSLHPGHPTARRPGLSQRRCAWPPSCLCRNHLLGPGRRRGGPGRPVLRRSVERVGCPYREYRVPEAAEAQELNPRGLAVAAEAYTIHQARLERHFEDYDPIVRQRMMQGKDVSATEYLNTTRAWIPLRAKVLETLRQVDALLVPTTMIPPLPVLRLMPHGHVQHTESAISPATRPLAMS